MNDEDIVKKVFLLAIYKQEVDETLDDTLKALVNTGMFELKEGKVILQELKDEQYILNEKLSLKGVVIAQQALKEFTIG